MAVYEDAGKPMASGLDFVEGIIDKIRQVPSFWWRRACVVILSLWLVFSLSQLFWVIMPQPDIPSPSLEVAANSAFADKPSNSISVDIESLKELALFGDGSATAAAPIEMQATGIESEAVDTRLKLKLVGTVASSDESLGKAFIADGPKQDTFSPGDELTLGPNGVKIAKILIDRVILDNNGRYETLWLYQGKEDFVRSGRTARSRQAVSRTPPRANRRDRRLQNEENVPAIENARDLVGAVLPVNGQNVPSANQIKTINELVNVNMHREGGSFVGFKINPKRNPEMFEQLGLKPNDIVTAVNNIGLDSTNRAMQVYRSLSTTSQASLEILRDGNTVTVDVNLEQ
ncbi:MAG: type II secretion system protein GspC [Cellvibrionaceae bacterium]